jgi:tRNA threonylcarbamoyladenosine biosynthesis protein TsaE
MEIAKLLRAEQLSQASLVLPLLGDLGAGKTTLLKGVIHGVTGVPIQEIHSPTFTYLQTYGKDPVVSHFDLYRLSGIGDFVSMGLDEVLSEEGIVLIEWSERIMPLLEKNGLKLSFLSLSPTEREITLFL